MLFIQVKMQAVDLVAEGGLRNAQGARKRVSEKSVVSFVKEKCHWANKCLATQQAWRRPGRGRGGRREGFGNAGRLSSEANNVSRQSANRAAVARGGTP